MAVAGALVLATMLSILMPLSEFYGSGQNIAGASAGVAMIFLFSGLNAVFFNSTTFTIAAEIMPQHLRGLGMGFALACKGATSLWLSQVTPIAFAAISWRFYAVFVATLIFGAFFCAFLLPETLHMSLEEIGTKFGDKQAVGDLDEVRKEVKAGKVEAQAEEVQVENEQTEKSMV